MKSIRQALADMKEGTTSAVALAQEYLAAAREGAALNAYITLRDEVDVLADARAADRARDQGEAGPLAGVPIALKDNLCTTQMKTTAASKMLADFQSPYDATVVKKLRDAGAVVLGKTNLDEFAFGSSNEHSAFGPVKNPRHQDHVPGGSSGGSAAAVAGGLALAALGSDTGGSIRQPASHCGIVGLKPTYGRVSRYGLIAFASSLDQIGPMTTCVWDAACLLEVIAGADPHDMTSVDKGNDDWTGACEKGVEGLKVGVPAEYFSDGLTDGVRQNVEEAIEGLREAGATVQSLSLPHTRFAVPTYYLIATAEASSNLARFDGVRYGHRAQASDLETMYARSRSEAFGAEVRRRIMLGTYVLSSGFYDQYYGKAQRVRTLIARDFEMAFEKVDVILSPTTPAPAFRFGEKSADPLQMYLEDVYTIAANLAGLPAISVPCGLSDGMPVGLQLMGRPFDEATLFSVAAACEGSR